MSFLFYKSNAKEHLTCSHREISSPGLCQECENDVLTRRKYRWLLIFCLVWPYALQALDSTIIASALFWIAKDFGEISQQNWIISTFNLTSAAFIPFWAQIADVFGRHIALSSSILLMILGSGLCTAAPTNVYGVMLLGRAFQGISASGLNVLTRTVLADRVSLEESAKSWAIFSIVGGFSYGLGPVIGGMFQFLHTPSGANCFKTGYLTKVNWRWCFAINLPIAVFGLFIVFILLRKHLLGPQQLPELDETAVPGRRNKFLVRLQTIDFGGQILFVAGSGLVILGLTWGGAAYPWDSAAVITSLAIGSLLLVVFVLWERLLEPGRYLANRLPKQKPMIPWSLISTKDMGLLFYIECATGISMFSVLYFCNAFFVRVKNYQADKAGLQLLCFVPGLGVGVYMCTFLCNRWPRMTYPPLFLGTILETFGVAFLALAMHNGHPPTIFGLMALAGIGMGLKFMVAPLHGIGLFKTHRATVLALIGIAVPFGGTLGLTIMSTVFNNTAGLDVENSGDYSEDTTSQVQHGIVYGYVSIIPFMALSCIACLFMGTVILGKESPENGQKTEDAVIHEPYLWYLLRGQNKQCDNKRIAMNSLFQSQP
ncbi:hypothetical protein NQ176_g5725 [Zarea fungicola]|uniref:Uncharacterized protein n=1 Tax=Zarea fungicola TaxID=93591 RepID=A0ACC1N745_9HYPO|nr:hypothetical protein NQ176_g5725 [Lecanicillium fungicola]